jgi:lipid-A-disaccharide synthase
VADTSKQIMLVVGEASGDAHGARLVEALHQQDSTLKVFGVAGDELKRTHFEELFSVAQLTGMGFAELAGKLRTLWRAYHLLKQALMARRPNLLVLIDFPDFNLRLARVAKSLGIPVLYYISPQIWAWRRGRVKKIARLVDHMAVVFPFEEVFYQRHQVPTTFVGHPLLDSVKVTESRESVLTKIGLDAKKITIALLPGSRRGEVSRHLGVMRDAALRLQGEMKVQFFCLRASTIAMSDLRALLPEANGSIPVVEENRYNAINAADLVWTASGTATLEVGLLGKPMIIVYRMAWLTSVLAKLLVRVEHFGMVNLIAEERVVPELFQTDVTADRLVRESRRLLDDDTLRVGIGEKLSKLRERLGAPGAAKRVADLALAMMA